MDAEEKIEKCLLDNKEYRFISDIDEQNTSRLVLLQCLSIVIKNGMKILGVSTPASM